MDRRVIDVAEVMGKAELSYLPVLIATMCGLLAVCDGLDNQALAFTAPVIAGHVIPFGSSAQSRSVR